MARVCVFGAVAADIVLRLPAPPHAGEHLNADPLGWRPGGSSANLACALASAGHHVDLVGPVGDDPMGKALLQELHRWGVHTDHTLRVPALAPRALILLDDTGERTIIGLGPRPPIDQFPPTVVPDLATTEGVYVESFTRYPPALLAQAGLPATALIVAPPPDHPQAQTPADLIVGSRDQFPQPWLTAPFTAARQVAGARLRCVIVTAGARGAVAYRADGTLHVPAPAARQVDATGAGDAFTAGLLHALLDGQSLQAALELGSTWGAHAVERLQSLPPAWQQLLDHLTTRQAEP
jgi:sugar/nucleoside kinase (ribokinase family)